MSVPVGYDYKDGAYWKFADGSGPYAITPGGVAVPLVGSFLYAVQSVDSTLTGVTTEESLFSVLFPAGLLGPNDVLSVHPLWSYTNSANNKTLRVKFGANVAAATSVWSAVNTTTLSAGPRVAMRGRNSLTAQIMEHVSNSGFGSAEGYASSGTDLTTTAIDFSVDQTLFITGQLASAAESIVLRSVLVRIEPFHE
jgi:hypothetical protein